MTPRNTVRLVDIAEQAGVTVSTASRALSRPEMVRPETRERVQAAANALGYVPNRLARGLITGRSSTIVMVLPDMTSPLFAFLAQAAQAEARGRGFDVLVADSRWDDDREIALVDRAKGYAEGVIVCMPSASHPVEADGPPIVAINRRMRGAHAVVLDQATIVETQLAHLLGLGHERILSLSGPKKYWAAHERRRHAERLAGDHHLEISAPIDPTFDAGVEFADHIDPDVTAVIAFTDGQAAGLIARLAERGIRVPEDVSVIGANDVPLARMMNPALTTMRAPLDAMGRAAVSLLLDHLQRDGGPTIVETMSSELIVRRSTAPPRGTWVGSHRSVDG